MAQHDPLKFARDLSAKLAARSRHVCVFLGAGIAKACGLPDVKELQGRVLDSLSGNQKEWFQHLLEGQNLEQALSQIRRIAALLKDGQSLGGITGGEASALDTDICKAITKSLDTKGATLDPVYRLAAWAGRADYLSPIELFTVNYDLLLETALEQLGIPYFDGFIGILRGKFRSDLVEADRAEDGDCVPAFFVRLWKLHGSVNWTWSEDRQIVRLGQAVRENAAAAIYPSDAKYEESRRVPFLVLQDRLRRALNKAETFTIVAGYSFLDDHLNELMFDAATRRARSEFVVFCHSRIPDVVAARAKLTPNLQVVCGAEAILGGIRAHWTPPQEAPSEIWENGKLALADFTNLAAYLSRSSPRRCPLRCWN